MFLVNRSAAWISIISTVILPIHFYQFERQTVQLVRTNQAVLQKKSIVGFLSDLDGKSIENYHMDSQVTPIHVFFSEDQNDRYFALSEMNVEKTITNAVV